MKSSYPRAAPSRCSATATRFTSFSYSTGMGRKAASSSSRVGECQPGRCEAYRSRPVPGSNAPGVPMTTRCTSDRVSPASLTAPSSASATWRTTLSARRPGVRSSNSPTVSPVTSATAATIRWAFTSSPATWAAEALTA